MIEYLKERGHHLKDEDYLEPDEHGIRWSKDGTFWLAEFEGAAGGCNHHRGFRNQPPMPLVRCEGCSRWLDPTVKRCWWCRLLAGDMYVYRYYGWGRPPTSFDWAMLCLEHILQQRTEMNGGYPADMSLRIKGYVVIASLDHDDVPVLSTIRRRDLVRVFRLTKRWMKEDPTGDWSECFHEAASELGVEL